MATKQATNTVLRRFGYTSIEFYRNNMQKVTDFGRCEVTSFHFEEGISHPYTGILNLITQNAVDFGKLDLTYLYVKISYQINYVYEQEPEEYNTGDTRTVWALIKTVTNLPKVEKVNPYNTNEKFNYQYQLTLESPLARLNNKQTIFSELKISQILSELLNRGDSKEGKESAGLYNPLLCEIDVSKIQNLAQLDTRTLKIQRGQEKTLSFFNRILIAYGINYVLDFDENKGVKIIFSCDQDYKKKFAPNCTNDLNIASKDINYIYLANATLKKNSIQFDEARVSAKSLKNSWLDLEADRTDTSGIKSSQLKLFYKNLCIRNLAVNPKLSAQSVQDIRLEPGLILNSDIDSITSKYVVENLITDITTVFKDKSKENTVQIKNDCLELVDHPAFVELDDKSDGDYFEFDSKTELGCLVHQEVDSLESLDPKQSIDIIEAQACSENGSVDITQAASFVKDTAKNNDLFYAFISGNNSKIIIQVHTLIDADTTTAKKIMQGQRIMVLQKGGTYYLYGYVPEPLAVDDDKWEGISQDIVNFRNESSISIQNYKTNDEYIYSLLKTGAKAVESAVVYQALDENQPELHDDIYLNNYKSKVEEKHKDYKTKYEAFQNALITLYNKYEDGKFLQNYIDASGAAKNDAPNEVKQVVNCKSEYKISCENLMSLAKDIVKNCHITIIKEAPKNVMTYTNPGGFSFNSTDGSFEITAKKIVLNADNINITASEREPKELDPVTNAYIETGNISISAANKVNSKVGCASVKTDKTGVTISAGATFFGQITDKDDVDKGDALSSKFSVKTYDGISASAFSVSMKAGSSLALKGPLGSGINLGYGSVKVVGSEIKLNTIGKREQVRNITEHSMNFLADLIASAAAGKESAYYKVYRGLKEGGFYIYDKGLGGYKTFSKLNKTHKKYKSGDKPLFDYIQAICDTIIWVVDLMFALTKSIIEKIEKDRTARITKASKDKKKIDNSDQTSKYTPWGNPSTLSTRMDQIILYYTHLKTIYNLVLASATAYRSGASGWVEPAVSEFSMNAHLTKISAQYFVLHKKEEEDATVPIEAATECEMRDILRVCPHPAGP